MNFKVQLNGLRISTCINVQFLYPNVTNFLKKMPDPLRVLVSLSSKGTQQSQGAKGQIVNDVAAWLVGCWSHICQTAERISAYYFCQSVRRSVRL